MSSVFLSGFPTVTQNRDTYQSIDHHDQPDNSAKPYIQGEDQKHGVRAYWFIP